MIEFRHILCPIDFSETSARALSYATAFATWYEAQLTVLHVAPTFDVAIVPSGDSGRVPSPGSRDDVIARIRRSLEQAGATALDPRPQVEEGRPAALIVNSAAALKADLLVMGTHGLGGFHRLVLGSVTEKVVRTATCPVLTVPPSAPAATTAGPGVFKKILCPIDYSPSSLKALRYALELGRQADGCVTALYALEYLDPDEPCEHVDFDIRRRRQHFVDHARERLHAQVAQESKASCEIEEAVAIDRAYKAILERAALSKTDLIVVGAQGTSGIELMLYGSNTQHVVRAAACPCSPFARDAQTGSEHPSGPLGHGVRRRTARMGTCGGGFGSPGVIPRVDSSTMIWIQFLAAALVIVLAGVRLARYGDVLGEKIGLARSWVGVVLLAATTSLPELLTGFGATALAALPDIAVGDVMGSCMFNLLILSFMDAVQPEPLSTRAHQGHALSIGFGLVLIGVAGLGLLAGPRLPAVGWIGLYSPVLIAVYFMSMRLIFTHEQHRRAREIQEVAEELQYAEIQTRTAALLYTGAAVLVVGAALWLPRLGAQLARQTGLGEAFVGSVFIAITTSLPEIVVSLAAVRIGAIDLGIGNVLGSNLFNLLILGLDDVFYRQGPLLAAADASHSIAILAVVVMNALFLIGLTYRVITKRFVVAWDTGAIAAVYVAAVGLVYLMRG